MSRLLSNRRFSFQAKVLIPVIGIMVLLVAATIFMVNRSLITQFRAEAGRKLSLADTVFNNSDRIRAKNLWLRYRNVPNEPRFKAVSQKADVQTLRFLLAELLDELGAEFALFTPHKGKTVTTATRDPGLDSTGFQTACSALAARSLEGESTVDTIIVGDRLFDAVSIPVSVGNTVVAALTFGDEIGQAAAEEFKQFTHTEIVFLLNDRLVVSTLSKPNLQQDVIAAFGSSTAGSVAGRAQEAVLDGEHYVGLAGRFGSPGGSPATYLILSSYEQPLKALRATQRMLALIGLLGIALSTGIVYVLIRKITQPLRQLRDSAEAVGRGDFSRRVEVSSRDECGELAEVFNQMTINLKSSREQLEKALQTLKATQAQLIQSEKLSAVGEFVAGVAHELNNPLTAVVGFAEVLQQGKVSEQHRKFLGLIVASAERCHKIVQSLLSFARQHKPERRLVKLDKLIEEAVAFLQYQMRTSNVVVTTHFDPLLPPVMADPHQLQQVFLNIINNARQAIEGHRRSGSIRISTEKCQSGVRVRFQDDGPGISSENINRIFNPFFTTKEVGKGTGLGLSVSYGIVQEHGGSLTVESEPGAGATFIIDLPASIESENAVVATVSTDSPHPVFNARGKRVLVVDDEDSILRLVREYLRPVECHVETATDGHIAIHQLGQQQFDLTVCDWKMPGLGGRQVYEHMRAVDPAAASKFIFMTGDVMNQTTQDFLKEHNITCIPKPFSMTDFHSAVEKALKVA